MESASTATIASHAWACTIRFNALVSQASQTSPAFEDQLARFNIWAGSIGVFAEAHASLDYRVRNSPKVNAMMMRLLQALKRKLQYALDTVERHRETNSDNNILGAANMGVDDNQSESSQSETSKTSSMSSSSSRRSSAPNTYPTPLDKSVKDLEAAITRLHRLTMSIRKSSTHNRNLTGAKFAILDEDGQDTTAQFEIFALRLAQARFPVANPILHKRLANLTFQRRRMFSYQQRHQQKLAKVVYPPTRQSMVQHHLGTIPQIQLQPSQPSQESGPSAPKVFLQRLAINKALSTTTASALTVTSVLSRPAPSIVSWSAASSNPNPTAALFPPAPTIGPDAKEFQCPYCGLMLGIKDRKPRRWRKHVINDLEPYVCLFENCNEDDQSFRNVDDWIKHMRGKHTLQWYCGVSGCQNQVFDDATLFKNHMEVCHPRTYSSSQLPMLIESMRRPATELFEYCPLCNYVPESQQTFVGDQTTPIFIEKANNLHKHVATHLEGFALISLPWQNDENDANNSSRRGTQSKEKVSSLKNAGVGGLDDVSLNFDDPPKFELFVDEQQELGTVSQSEEAPGASEESEWGFMPSIPYGGHSEDRVLQSLIRKYLSSHPENQASNSSIDGEFRASSTRVELRTICDWISRMDFTAKQGRVLGMRQRKTCEWFLQSPVFTNFIARTKKVLWAPGIPGSGKTVLASAIIDHLKHYTPSSSHRAAVAYAYCEYGLQKLQTAMCLISCFLRQFLEVFWEANTVIPHDVQATYELHKDAKTTPSTAEYLKMFASVVRGCGSAFVVVDALDECTPDTRRELIEILKSEPGIQLLITSRYLGDIKEILGDAYRVDVLASKEDLRSYAQVCIERYPLLQTQLGSVLDEEREGYLDKIAHRAAGMFPVAQHLVDSWAEAPRQLGAGPPSLSHISREMDLFYSRILERIFHQPSPHATLARLVLIWVTFSTRPLTIRELTNIIGAEVLADVTASHQGVQVGSELFTAVCAGVLAIDSDISTLRAAHVTLKEYLQRNREDIFPQLQEYITTSCVEYLSLQDFNVGPCTSDQGMLTRLHQHPFFHYAAKEWGHHALGVGEVVCKEAIITFLNNKIAVESAMQAKSMPSDWQFFPQSVDYKAYPHDIPGIAVAALFGLATIVEAMLGSSSNETSNGENNEKALFWAATGGAAEVAKLLLVRGVSPNVPGAMSIAAENGHHDIIRILIANGGDVNASGYEVEGNALQIAAIKGNEILIRLLLEHGADPNIEGGDLGSVLHIAAVNGDENITRLLLEHGADPNTKGGMYGFALQAAVEEGHENIIQMLLDNGAEVNLEGGPYGNAFQAAAENGDKNIVELLLAHGANIDTMIGGERYTALQEVARRGSETMVELLIDKGANIGSRQRNGLTALHQAAKEGHVGVVALLLRKGANHNTLDQRGFTALDWARKKNFPEVVEALQAVQQ